MADVRGAVADLVEGPKRELVADARGTDAGPAPAPAKKKTKKTPVPVDIDIHTWSGKYKPKEGSAGTRLRRFLGNTTDFIGSLQGEVSVSTIDGLVDAVHERMREARADADSDEAPYLRELELIGHGSSGNMSGVVRVSIPKAARDRLATLRPYFGKDSKVTLFGCEVAQGYMGETMMQNMADTWDVPVSATTGVRNPVFGYNAGYEVTRRPGEKVGSWEKVTAGQIARELQEDDSIVDLIAGAHSSTYTRLGRILKHLEGAANITTASGTVSHLPRIRKHLEADDAWDDLVELLASDEVADDDAIRRRVKALAIPEVNAALAAKKPPPAASEGP